MITARNKGRFAISAAAVGAVLALSGCGSGDPLDAGTSDESTTGEGGTVVVGSQAYYSNEIIAEIYSQALEEAGYTVTRQFQIGQRDAYLPALESGEVDVIPEYTGNLLQFYDETATATASDEVYAALGDTIPSTLAVLEQSPATDQDSYNVTAAFAEENGVASIADLADVPGPLVLGGNAELETRPYGPAGLASVYGVTVDFSATGDTTVEALVADTVQIANVYSADPRIASEDLVTLEDPEGMFLASNVVPLVNAELADELAEVLDPVDAALTSEGLIELNVRSTDDQESSDTIATDWLTENGFLE
jgi:osmoprotectant transport system substrate-binding protein